MLVLTRRLNEQIVVGQNVFIKILSIQGGRVKIGVVAPDHISITREENFVHDQTAPVSEAGCEADLEVQRPGTTG